MEIIYILLFLAFLIILIIFGIIVYNIYQDSKHEDPPIPPLPTNNCTRPASALINVSSITNCNDVLGNQTPFKYVCPGNNFPLYATVSTVPVPYLAACAGFCGSDDFTNNICNNPTDQYNTCIQLTKPVNCNGASFPVGYDGNNNYYYVYEASTGPCVNPQCQNS